MSNKWQDGRKIKRRDVEDVKIEKEEKTRKIKRQGRVERRES